MNWLINFTIVLAAFFGMEGVAWLTYKYITHGISWPLHRDHHLKEYYGKTRQSGLLKCT